MKVLHIDMNFRLPDNFTGTFEDAVLTWLSYRNMQNIKPNEAGIQLQEYPTSEELRQLQFDVFMDLVWGSTDYKYVGVFGMHEYDYEKNEWINLMSK
jgi:hypothetical protein